MIPFGKPPEKKPKIAGMMLTIAKKGGDPVDDGASPSGDAPDSPLPAKPPTPPTAKPATASMKPGSAWFTGQDQVCSSCEYFDDAGNGGVGACQKGVPEADYSQTDPSASRCRLFESKGDGDTPEVEAAEGEAPESVPA